MGGEEGCVVLLRVLDWGHVVGDEGALLGAAGVAAILGAESIDGCSFRRGGVFW